MMNTYLVPFNKRNTSLILNKTKFLVLFNNLQMANALHIFSGFTSEKKKSKNFLNKSNYIPYETILTKFEKKKYI